MNAMLPWMVSRAAAHQPQAMVYTQLTAGPKLCSQAQALQEAPCSAGSPSLSADSQLAACSHHLLSLDPNTSCALGGAGGASAAAGAPEPAMPSLKLGNFSKSSSSAKVTAEQAAAAVSLCCCCGCACVCCCCWSLLPRLTAPLLLALHLPGACTRLQEMQRDQHSPRCALR